MKRKKTISPGIFLVFYLLVLFVIVVYLSKDNNDKRTRIIELEQNKRALQSVIDRQNSDLNRIDLLKYKEKIMKKKYPLFSKISEVVFRKSIEHDINPDLILALIEIESAFKPYSVSNRGAYGLMQINYKVWKDELKINASRIFDIEYNVELGIRILKNYLKVANGDLMKALHLYNNGYLYNNEKYKYKVISTIFF